MVAKKRNTGTNLRNHENLYREFKVMMTSLQFNATPF